MLAIPSWAMGEVGVDLEPERPKDNQEGRIKGKERDFSCSEKKEYSSKLTEIREQLHKWPETGFKQTPTLKERVLPATQKDYETPLAKRIERSVDQSLPRMLPRSEAPSLPKPFQQKPHSEHSQSKAALPSNKEVEKGHKRETSSPLCKRGEVSNQTHQQAEARVRDSLDQGEERKRNWTYEIEDDLRGQGVRTAPLPVIPKVHTYTKMEPSRDKPFLVRPRMGIFALYYILTKIGLISDSRSHYQTKQQIRLNQEETDKTHVERLAEMKKAIDEEKSTKRWSVATQVFSWFTSFLGIMTGIALIMTGVGVVAGALLLFAGLIMVTNQLMQLTGAWQKIAEKLPGTPEQKRSMIMWMQIGITVLCFILSGAGVVFGGFTAVKQAMEASQMVMGGVIMMGYGTTSFGEGVSNYKYRNRLAKIRQHQIRLAELKHRREDLQEMVESSMHRLEKLFEDLANLLEFETELFRADQKANR